MRRIEALGILNELTAELPVVVTCAATSRELASVDNRDNHFYVLDSISLVRSTTTGLALAAKDSDLPKVVGLEGDGSLLINRNVLPTGGFFHPKNTDSCHVGGQAFVEEVAFSVRIVACHGHDRPQTDSSDIGRSASGPQTSGRGVETETGFRGGFLNLFGGGRGEVFFTVEHPGGGLDADSCARSDRGQCRPIVLLRHDHTFESGIARTACGRRAGGRTQNVRRSAPTGQEDASRRRRCAPRGHRG